MNYSSNLPAEEQENRQTLNAHIERNMPFIPLLPQHKFQTEADDVHWTVETGSAMFDHWMAFLNFTAHWGWNRMGQRDHSPLILKVLLC